MAHPSAGPYTLPIICSHGSPSDNQNSATLSCALLAPPRRPRHAGLVGRVARPKSALCRQRM